MEFTHMTMKNAVTLNEINHINWACEQLSETNSINTFQGNDFAGWIHDCWIGANRSTDRICGVIHIDDNYLIIVTDLFTYTNEFVRLHRERGKWNGVRIDAGICELKLKEKK